MESQRSKLFHVRLNATSRGVAIEGIDLLERGQKAVEVLGCVVEQDIQVEGQDRRPFELGSDRIERMPTRWTDPVRAGVSYFRVPDKRMPRGRITLMENGQNATERVMYRDYQLLRQYGGYHGANHPADWQRTDVYLGIVHAGGIGEFDAEQVMDNWWHLRPGRDASGSHRLIWGEIDRLIGGGVPEEDAILTVP
jgi:hypothetical protein